MAARQRQRAAGSRLLQLQNSTGFNRCGLFACFFFSAKQTTRQESRLTMLTADTFVCLLKRRYDKTQVCGLLLCVCVFSFVFCFAFLMFCLV